MNSNDDKQSFKAGVILFCAFFGMACFYMVLNNIILSILGTIVNIFAVMIISSAGYIIYPGKGVTDEETRKGAIAATNVLITVIAIGVTATTIPFTGWDGDGGVVMSALFFNAWAARTIIVP